MSYYNPNQIDRDTATIIHELSEALDELTPELQQLIHSVQFAERAKVVGYLRMKRDGSFIQVEKNLIDVLIAEIESLQ